MQKRDLIQANASLENLRQNLDMKDIAKEILLEENYNKFIRSYKFQFVEQIRNKQQQLYKRKNPPRMPSQNGKAPRRYSFTGYIAVCGSFLYTAPLCPHQRYFRRVGTRTLISIGFAIWSFIPASSATCLSSEKALAVIAMMGIFAFWGSSSLRIFLAAS